MRKSVLVLLFAALVAALPAFAHDTWLSPSRHRVLPGASVTLSLTSGMGFPALDYAIQRDRVATARARTSAGKIVDLASGRAGRHALQFRQKLSTPGVTTIWTVLNPRPSELNAEQVREYVEHLGLADPDAVIRSWEALADRQQVRYRYTKFAKTFVRVGSKGGAATATQPTGMRLELLPVSDLTTARRGDTMRFQLLQNGKPLARYPVSASREGSAAVSYTTDASGFVTVDLPAAGPYLVKAATLTTSAAPDTEWDVDFTTLTFDVSPG